MYGSSAVLVAALAAAGLGWMLYLALVHQGAFLGLILFLTVVEATRDFGISPTDSFESAWYIGHTGTLMTFGSVEVHIDDLLTVVCAAAAIIGVARFRGGALAGYLIASIAALVLIGLLFFAQSVGITHSINYSRKWLLAISMVAYGATTTRPWNWQDLRWVVAAGLLACVLAAAEIRLHGLGSAVGLTVSNGVALNGRPLGPQAVLIILLAAWAVALAPGRLGATRILLIALFATTILAAQVRSVWLAAAIGLIVWWAVRLAGSNRFVLTRLAWSVVGVILGLVVLAATVLRSNSLQQSLTDQSTYQWRLSRWDESLGIARSSIEWLLGGTFGPTPASVIDSFHGLYAHSLYLWSTETIGIVGAAMMLILIAALCLRSPQGSGGSWPLITGVTALAYGYTYGLPGWYWLMIGLCAGWMAKPKAKSAEVRQTAPPSALLAQLQS